VPLMVTTRTMMDHRHYPGAVGNTNGLFHPGILDQLPRSGGPSPVRERRAEVLPLIGQTMTLTWNTNRPTCRPKMVSAIATRLTHFGYSRPTLIPDWNRSPNWRVARKSSAVTRRPVS
jgi:hypothetical protein